MPPTALNPSFAEQKQSHRNLSTLRTVQIPQTPSLTEELILSAHPERINGVAFPVGYSEVFATASAGAVRVWHLDSCRELLRIAVPNLECKCLVFAAVRGRRLAAGRGRGGSRWEAWTSSLRTRM